MSSAYVIVCPRCGSFKIHRTFAVTLREKLYELLWSSPPRGGQRGNYACEACGESFTVRDPAAHARDHPADLLGRCRACDRRGGLELVRRNHRYPGQPPEEIADLYRCPDCGSQVLMVVKEDPLTLYH
jgi:DNA-directed RNA polymerase subunit RPC12/RpoP